MKVYLSCARNSGRVTRYHLHMKSPAWMPSEGEHDGGLWWSQGMHFLCESAVEGVFGDQAPAPGELLELDVQPGQTWVWK